MPSFYGAWLELFHLRVELKKKVDLCSFITLFSRAQKCSPS